MRKKVIKNPYKVGVSQWRKWSDDAKIAFNSVYEEVTGNQTLVCATDIFQATTKQQKELVDKVLNAAIWNICWIIADHITEQSKTK